MGIPLGAWSVPNWTTCISDESFREETHVQFKEIIFLSSNLQQPLRRCSKVVNVSLEVLPKKVVREVCCLIISLSWLPFHGLLFFLGADVAVVVVVVVVGGAVAVVAVIVALGADVAVVLVVVVVVVVGGGGGAVAVVAVPMWVTLLTPVNFFLKYDE
eukprot:scaffold211_cov141-Alexandrium_tamarense.AAC.1